MAHRNPGDETNVAPNLSLSRRGWVVLALVVVAVQFPLVHRFLLRGGQPAPVGVPYTDTFNDSSTIQAHYWSTGGLWRVINGELFSPGVKNNPLWLMASLPRDVAIEFDVRSQSPEGDVKVEVFGDGLNHASGYVLIHGGWNNTVSVIARLDEHGMSLDRLRREAKAGAKPMGQDNADLVASGHFTSNTHVRVEAAPFPVTIGRTYHWRIERQGTQLRWLIDGAPFMQFDDPLPLEGRSHDRFGFSSWDADLYFDNLRISAL